MPRAQCDRLADQFIQIFGAVLILVAYAGAQFGRMSQHSLVYLALNAVGSAILGVLAAIYGQLGFLLLEAVWTGVSLWSLLAVVRGQTPVTE
jgi:hypothetical protein